MVACTTPSPPVVRLPIAAPPQVLPSVTLPPAEPPDLAPKLSVPRKPQDEAETVRVNLVARQGRDPSTTSIQSIALPLASTVVINIPVEGESGPPTAGATDTFRTLNYHNDTEDSIQKALIQKRLRVIDRIKYEAVLRDLRDIGQEFRDWGLANAHIYPDPALAAGMGYIADKLARGELSATEYNTQVARTRGNLGIGLQVGSRRSIDDAELVDAAELIRTAVVSGTAADYILQVNRFRGSVLTTSTRLLENPGFRAFAHQKEAVRKKYRDVTSSHFRCDSLQMEMQAKLIDVASGDVIWIGTHTVTELDGKPIELEISYSRVVDNYPAIVEFVDTKNRREERIRRFDQDVRLPDFTYTTTVTDPQIVSSIVCETSKRRQHDMRSAFQELTDRLITELIGTIRVSSE